MVGANIHHGSASRTWCSSPGVFELMNHHGSAWPQGCKAPFLMDESKECQ